MSTTSLMPMLTVSSADSAIGFYREAFGAVEERRFVAPTGQVVAMLAIDGLSFVVDENVEAFNISPASLGGTTVRISLMVDDPDAVATRAVAAGATEIFPVADQPYGLGKAASPIPTGTTG